MATTDKESSAAGTDSRPPMLEESDFESWKIRIERYIRGKPLGKLIWKSIKNGPSPHPMITVTTGEGEQQTQVAREKTDEEFTEAENNKERADIQATNILRSGLTEQQKKETLFYQYKRFQANGNESIYDYFVQFHKLINDMKITKMEIPVHQRNTKFVNNLPSYWGKYVTIVKNNKDISTVSYVDLYTYSKSYEQHALKTLSKMNQTSRNADPLAYMAKATQSTSSPSQYVPPPPKYASAPQQAPQSTNDAMLATMNQIVNLLSGFQKQFPPTNNQLRTSTNPKTQATIQAGHVARKCKDKKRAKDSQWFKDKALLMEAKENGAILDAEAEAFLADVECTTPYTEPLAITTTTAFEVSHEDAYDSDVDEAPYAAAAFMTNMMQTGPSIRQGTSNDTDFHSEVKKDLEQLVFERNKRNADLEEQLVSLKQQLLQHVESNKSLKTESEKLKADKNALEESYLEELVWLRNTNKVVTELLQSYGQPVQTVPMLSKRPTFSTKDLHKSALGHRNPLVYDSEETLVQAEVSRTKMLERMKDPLCKVSSKPINYAKLNSLYDTFVPQKQLSSEQTEYLSKDICFVVLTSDIVVPMSVEPRSNCVKEHSRNLELEAEILKVKQLLVEKEKRCSFIETKYQELELKFQKYKECFENPQKVRPTPIMIPRNFQALETENTQLKEELTAVRIKNDSLRDENVSIKKHYQDLYKSKAESNSNVSSRAAVPEKPKVLAPGLYAMTPKYIPPQKRNNREANTPLPRKETMSLVKNTNVNLPARSENVKRVDNPLRNLNKRNRVDSSLSVKRTGFISKSVFVCKTCNECLVFGNHIKCGVKNLNSVNVKNPKVKNNATMKQVWKATGKIFASVGSNWKPTGRKFTLGDTCPLTRITKPEVVPLEKSGSVSTSEPANNVIVTPSPPNTETKAVNDPVNVNDLSANQLDPNKN
ncbi:hypothetical protein Tco_0628466 [Tanacetum coccineum]|uniref:Integrase, catalytic region, zinc finger, CCHC-type, peptidase aspartic, catalytic n=1 Tax=Tanacetum coccineum TaxID=301880 RepID=A0ABQ4WQE3_9ASTR